MKAAAIINPDSSNAREAIAFLSKRGVMIVISESKRGMEKALKACISSGHKSIIVCGGDGTINNFVNGYMKLAPNVRAGLKIGFFPSGNANDFHRSLDIPKNFANAYRMFASGRTRKIDAIEVNHKFFVTGGGFGFPSELVFGVENVLSSRFGTQIRNLKMKDSVFFVSLLNMIIYGYEGVKLKDSEEAYSIIAVCNQPFIGKLFRLSPKSKNDDGRFEICMIKKSKSAFGELIRATEVIRGRHADKVYASYFSTREFTLDSKKETYFMADGEIIAKGKKFSFRIVPKAINVLC